MKTGFAGGLAAVGEVLHREGVYLWYYWAIPHKDRAMVLCGIAIAHFMKK